MTKTDSDEVGKLFIGGLSWETTKETMERYFSKYGEVIDCVVMKNSETGRSRGFGFITFKDPNCVSMVLQSGPHELNGRKVDPKECTPRAMQKAKKSQNQAKIFLGGLPLDITENEIRQAMSSYGKVTEIIIMYDQEKKKSRGFGFLSFESDETTEQVCGLRYVNIKGKQVECKWAEPKENRRGSNDQGFSGNQRPPSGMNKNWPQSNPMPSSNATGGYHWNVIMQQPYSGQPAPTYGNYPNWNAASNSYSTNVPTTLGQYAQTSYQTYNTPGNYSYTQNSAVTPTMVPNPTPNTFGTNLNYAYSQNTPMPTVIGLNSSSSYGTAPNYAFPPNSAVSTTVTPNPSANSYGGSITSYPQDSSNYGPSKTFAGYQKTNSHGNPNGSSVSSNYQSSQGDSHMNKGQSFHPYRR